MNKLVETISHYIQIVMFKKDMILTNPNEQWPIVDVLMAWYSDGSIRENC